MIQPDPSPVKLDNSGTGPLRVPGFNGVPLFYEHSKDNRFAHGIADWRQSPQLFLREISMLQLMSYVTEQPDWENKTEDPQTLEEWHQHAVSVFDLDEPSWQWCVKELRDKAVDFKRTGYVAVFDADSRVIKSQVHDDLLKELRESMSPLFSQSRSGSPSPSDDTPGSDSESPVRHVVDPFMYPLVYGRTRVLTDGGKVDLERPESWRPSESQIAPIPEKQTDRQYEMQFKERKGRDRKDQRYHGKRRYWSNVFQCLPCEVALNKQGGAEIASYVNGVHPKERGIYKALEGLISAAMQPWNEMLIFGDQGRTPMRIRTYDFEVEGYKWYPKIYYYLDNARRQKPPITEEEWHEVRSRVREYLSLPEHEKRYRIWPDSGYHDLLASMQPWQWNSFEELQELVLAKGKRLFAVRGVEPGISFTYDEWKTGENTGCTIMPKWTKPDKPPPIPDPDHQYYSVSLQDQFEGLQIIVRVSTIELTPEQPLYGGDSHHNVTGILNEHIVSTATCYFDMHNIKDAKVSFQQETKIYSYDYNIAYFEVMDRLFDVPEWQWDSDDPDPLNALQTMGSIPISRNGQVIVWPGTLRSKAEPFSLADPLRPGYLRFATLWLVDPHYRICSTQNVPPQDPSWVDTSQSMKTVGEDESMTLAEAVEVRNQMRQERDKISKDFLRTGNMYHTYSEDHLI
ncbi:Protein of unknown function DUF4246 [Penicillium expansum]|uniref:Uncharacterized protein n=1 Tax=Penicillium expansum TaxID=27334 RepID=A0A0A2I897_PENEN|nr:Protein of unknown function DUF4246 [Penicillium expansum]KGO38628.1 Protein of unknown function DUF4246 [Penicillium expansum]KGO59468.1 Protein of unknown function DUF4246 [Penicillium expansum]